LDLDPLPAETVSPSHFDLHFGASFLAWQAPTAQATLCLRQVYSNPFDGRDALRSAVLIERHGEE